PPVAWIVRDVVWAATDDDAEAQLLDENWNPDETVILSSPPPGDMLLIEDARPYEQIGFFEVQRDSPTEKRYRVVTDGRGYLVLATTWYPGWEVFVDGREATLYRANLNFMAVEIPA